jgi:hypothetical protein
MNFEMKYYVSFATNDFQSFKLGQHEILCFCQTSSLGIIKETLNYNKG